MLMLGKAGYSPSGHGCGFGGEDWSLIKYFGKNTVYVSVSSPASAYVNVYVEDDEIGNQVTPFNKQYKSPIEAARYASKLDDDTVGKLLGEKHETRENRKNKVNSSRRRNKV